MARVSSARAAVWAIAGCAAALLAGAARSQEVAPDYFRDPGLHPNRAYVNQHFNEHIDPFTGNLQLHYVDLHLPGNGGFDLNITRSYNSGTVDPFYPSTEYSVMGVGWTMHFGRVLKAKNSQVCLNSSSGSAGVSDNPVLELPDGSRQLLTFTDTGSPLMLTAQRWKAECSGSTGLIVYSPDGVRYDMTHMASVGTSAKPIYGFYTTRITDRNGNYATVSYAGGATPQMTGVSTSDGRSVTFTYADAGRFGMRITSISAAGKTFSYGYTQVPNTTDRYFLTTATRPDGTAWRYEYNGQIDPTAGSYAMNRLTYPQEGWISYEYGYVFFDQATSTSRSTVLTHKYASTGGNWSFNYTPGTAVGSYDVTTVTNAAVMTTYRHIGANYVGPGQMWMVGLLASKTIGSMQTESYTWDKQKISSESYSRPGVFATKIDSNEYNAPVLTQKTITRDGATYTTTYSNFDNYGNPRTVTESGRNGGNRTTTLTYYANTTKWIVKQPQNESFTGGTITRTFDASGNLASITRDGITTSYSYDGDGNITTATYPRGLVRSYSNYKRGIAQYESQPEGVSLQRVVSDAGNVTSETNGENRTTGYAYDDLDRITAINYPAGTDVSIVYTPTTKTATRGPLVERTTYDPFGRVLQVELGGISRTFRYDALGRKVFESYPNSTFGTSYQYDVLDRVTRITHADNTYQTIAYGAATKTVTNERGHATTHTYRIYGDPDRQVLMGISTPGSLGNVTLTRNAKDLVTSITQGGRTRNYTYDSSYYLIRVDNPETGSTTYGRDAAGNMTSRQVGSSGLSTYTYDGQNRLTQATYPGGLTTTQTYTRTHKLKTVSSSAATRSLQYDANDNLVGETLTVGPTTLTATYGYNSLDQLSSVTYPQSNRVVSYSPDALGRPTIVSGHLTDVDYWPSGQISRMVYANGTTTEYAQTPRLWPRTFRTYKASVNYVNNQYEYDGVGNFTSVSDFTDSSYNRTFGYDAIDRLTEANGPWGSGNIGYDTAGNITSQNLGAFNLNYSYDGNNRLSSVSGFRSTSFNYDAYGNIVSGSGSTYTYDGVPNLVCVNCADNALKVAYAYDGLNHRVSVTKAGVTTVEFHDSQGKLLVEYTPSTGRLVEHIYLGTKRIAQRVSGQ